jgi:threonine/homoserine/homoserine lactone efflux protein
LDLRVLLRGLVLGFSIAAPVGPIGVLCIRRTLAGGFRLGFASGLGAASADAVYGSIAAFGLTALSDLLVRQQPAFRFLGGVFLCYLGVRTFLAVPAGDGGTKEDRSLPGAMASTFLLTLTNPMTILMFAGMFAGLGLAAAGPGFAAAGTVVLGVFLGSGSWWLLLSGGVSLLRRQVSGRVLRWVNRASGVVIAAFGVTAILAGLTG